MEKMLRPKAHFTPKKGWINDPNGPVFYNGEYHLFFQHDPDSLVWDRMHWGHAVSKDLINWEQLPIALYPDEQGVIYSGSALVDHENITGFGMKDLPALLVFYTSHDEQTKREMQCLAYSTDGVDFTKYDKNPIIGGKENTPARDPHVFKNAVLGGYSLCLTVERAVEFYHSTDLISWTKTGEFTLPSYALHGMIECPCMISDRVSGKNVLMLSMDIEESEATKFPKGVPFHKRLMQYFVGSFDGNVFIADKEQNEVLLVDNGPDFYAGTVFSNMNDNILIAWLGNFSENAISVPTEKEGFKGILSYPRKLTLKMTENGYRLRHEFFPKPDPGYGIIYRKSEDEEMIFDGCVSEKITLDGTYADTRITLFEHKYISDRE